MKYLTSILSQSMLWAGIYFGVMKGIAPVANLFGVAVVFLALFSIVISLCCHWIFDTESNRIRDSFEKHSLGTIGNLAMKLSTLSIGIVLIMVGGGWLILGVLWMIAVLGQKSLKMRLDKEEIHDQIAL